MNKALAFTPLKRLSALAVLALSLSACSGMSGRQVSTVTGTVVGGVVGAAVTGGSTTGTVAGAAAGGLIGHELGKKK